jgi:hypothetical protein
MATNGCAMNKTVTFDPDEWQLVPRRATRDMVVLARYFQDIRNCDFGLVYRLVLAAAPVHDER